MCCAQLVGAAVAVAAAVAAAALMYSVTGAATPAPSPAAAALKQLFDQGQIDVDVRDWLLKRAGHPSPRAFAPRVALLRLSAPIARVRALLAGLPDQVRGAGGSRPRVSRQRPAAASVRVGRSTCRGGKREAGRRARTLVERRVGAAAGGKVSRVREVGAEGARGVAAVPWRLDCDAAGVRAEARRPRGLVPQGIS
jgi:hypothetical protein